MITLARYLWRQAPALLSLAVAGALATAVLMMLLLNILSQHLSAHVGQPFGWTLYVLASIAALVAQFGSTVLISRISARAVRRLRLAVVRDVLDAPLALIERVGAGPVRTALVEDAVRISSALPNALALLRDTVFAAGCLAFLAYLSLQLLAFLSAMILLGALLNRPLQIFAAKRQRAIHDQGELLSQLFSDLLDGFKELKVSQELEARLMGCAADAEHTLERAQLDASTAFSAANVLAVALFLLSIGVLVYSPWVHVPPSLLTTYIIILLLLLAPLQTISTAAQALGQAGISLSTIHRLQTALSGERECRLGRQGVTTATAPTRIELRGLCHTYRTDGQEAFALGPVTAHVGAGEALFIVGGNGSGKTTLIKLLAGVYPPQAGQLLINGDTLDPADSSLYRRSVSALFFEPCLFESFGGSPWDVPASSFRDDLAKLRLEHVIRDDKGLFAQAGHCSSGERKRLALLLALQEKKPILIFDEFAADQDPSAKELFYRTILPALKAQRKTLIVVTHDDRYFTQADHILQLERGMPPVFRTSRPAVQAVEGGARGV